MNAAQASEEGFALIALVVAIFLVLLVLGIAAPRVAQELRRDREVEAVHRANQYVRAIQVFYKKNGRYPTTMDQLEKTNNIRYLRQKYVDPTTGKADWRLIHVGEAKTTVKGFFGQPLSGLNTQNIGTGVGGATNVNSTSTSGSAGSASGGSSIGGSSGGRSGTGFSLSGGVGGSSTGGAVGSASSTSTNSNGGVGSQSATEFKGGGGPIVGIGSAASGKSILELNEQTTYETWEFLYDPRIEQMKARASLFGGGVTAANATTFGAAGSGISPATSTPTPTTPTGSTPTPP
ncbi:hypothetical protein BH10ACI4_BH10ACI4_24250 [soil metagenome]